MSLQETSVLMQFSAGLPGQSRKDKRTTAEVKAEKNLGANSGKWIKELYPAEALADVKKLQNEARAYHETVTFPFGGSVDADGDDQGKRKVGLPSVGILPAPLIKEYGDKMREFAGRQEVLVEKFLSQGQAWVDWAVQEHNGTFDPSNYPGCSADFGRVVLDMPTWREKMKRKFYLFNAPLPVPNAEQFTSAVSALLGVDVESVNLRVRDAALEAQKELLRRMIDPVKKMVEKLTQDPKPGKEDVIFRDTLIGNIRDMAALVPKMNLGGDPMIDGFAKEMEALTRYSPDALRESKETRKEAAEKAADVLKRLEGYGF